MEATTKLVRYVFLDIVSFTKGRSVEAQSEIVETMNRLVSKTIESQGLNHDDLIFLPTGDGMCIGILQTERFDAHLCLALQLLQDLSVHNAGEKDEMRRFEMRVGINENVDNIVLDIKGQRNLAGQGINMAQRIMDKADGSQILVGSSVFEVLSARERYMKSFTGFKGRDKHGNEFLVYQYRCSDYDYLNNDQPSIFRPRSSKPREVSRALAHYIAVAMTHREFALSKRDDRVAEYVLPILFYYMAEDRLAIEQTPESAKPVLKVDVEKIDEEYDKLRSSSFWLLAGYSEFLVSGRLFPFSDLFDKINDVIPIWYAPSQAAVDLLAEKFPEIHDAIDG